MIPPDVASALRLQLPEQSKLATQQTQTQPVAPTQRITESLGDLVPGQRVQAQILALLPNGTYRALVAQRDVTLAMPYAAKVGDTLELEVTESNGELTLAVVANRGNLAGGGAGESVSTTFSAAGKLIGDLMGGAEEAGKRAAPAPLNGSQPLIADMPDSAADIAPVLKQALSQSGVFYESHQARWVAGEFPLESLRQEPQGKIPVGQPGGHMNAANAEGGQPAGQATDGAANAPGDAGKILHVRMADAGSGENRIPQDLAPLVRQQLDGLANNSFAWQGQVWPGQNMQWEIGQPPEREAKPGVAEERSWLSRLKIDLPSLGGVDATLRLRPGGRVALSMSADSAAGETRLRKGIEALQKQFAAAGLELLQADITQTPSNISNGE